MKKWWHEKLIQENLGAIFLFSCMEISFSCMEIIFMHISEILMHETYMTGIFRT